MRALSENRAELDARERMIIASRFPWDQKNGATLGEIAAILGLGVEGVRQTQKKGLGEVAADPGGGPTHAMSRAWTSDPRLLARATSERPMC